MKTLILWSNELILSCFVLMWTFMAFYPTDLDFKANYLIVTFCVYLVGAMFIDAVTAPLKRAYKKQ